jgi:hypothetical protein
VERAKERAVVGANASTPLSLDEINATRARAHHDAFVEANMIVSSFNR